MQGADFSGRKREFNAWRAVLSAFFVYLIGIGLARFAYTPLLPAIVEAGWFAPSAAAYLGAANLAGYLAGALSGRRIAERFSVVATLRAMMLVATATFFACAFPLGFSWFFVWRFAAGLAGGVLMVLAATSVLPHVAASRRGFAGGVIFMGVGAGIAASGTLVPALLEQGVMQAWIGLGVLSLILSCVGWFGWPRATVEATTTEQGATGERAALRSLYAEYALCAAGWIPHMIFFVDFIVRGRGEGIVVGGHYWVLLGVGATVGPILAGFLADRIGFTAALRVAFVLQLIFVATPAFGLDGASLVASAVIVGASLTGTVPLVLGRVGELVSHDPSRHRASWSMATVFFAVSQASAAYAMSFIFGATDENYALLFATGAFAIFIALLLDLVFSRKRKPRHP